MNYRISLWLSLLAVVSIPTIAVKVFAQSGAQVTRTCVNGLMYRRIFNDGSPNGSQRNEDMSAELATRACNGVDTSEEALATRVCINGLMYRRIFNDGSPNGSQRNEDMSAELAVNSCSNSVANAPVNDAGSSITSGASGTTIIINNGSQSPSTSSPNPQIQTASNGLRYYYDASGNRINLEPSSKTCYINMVFEMQVDNMQCDIGVPNSYYRYFYE